MLAETPEAVQPLLIRQFPLSGLRTEEPRRPASSQTYEMFQGVHARLHCLRPYGRVGIVLAGRGITEDT